MTETTTQTHLPPNWREHSIACWGGHADAEKLRFMTAMQRAEGGLAKWNPWNTTLKQPGSTDYNTNVPPVQNYISPIWGVCALIMTLSEHDNLGVLVYPKLLGHLQSPAGTYTAEQILSDCKADIQHWGTDTDLIAAILAE